jgi:hypothetical protein
MRPIVVHYHLFKNAGSSVDDALERAFGSQHGAIEGAKPWDVVSPLRLANYLIDHPHLRSISSHQARLPLPTVPGAKILPILFLRHPMDRFGSVYEYEKRQPADSISPSVAIARNGDLRAFAEWTLSPEATSVTRNFQCAHVAGIDTDMRFASATEFHLKVALRRLQDLPVVGLVDRFDQSMQLFARLIHAHMPEFEAHYEVRNVSTNRSGTLAERTAAIAAQLGEVIYDRLCAANRLDMALYTWAQQRVAAVS